MKKNSNSDHPVFFKIVMFAAGLLIGFICIKILFLRMNINTDSMLPTLRTGDRILINKVTGIRNGDIIVFHSPAENGRLLVSRLIASEYETVEIRNKVVFVNDKKFDITSDTTRDEKIIYPMKFCYRDNMPPVKMQRNEYFVLGDNFDRSFDSRSFGKISSDAIVGKVVYKR